MAVPSGYDIGLDSTDPADALAVRGFMVQEHRQQDITPSSARRSDGDTRFQLIPSESFWSQNDFAGGYGRIWPPDPTMYRGPDEIDAVNGASIRPAFAMAEGAPPGTAGDIKAMVDYGGGVLYIAVDDGGTGKLYQALENGGEMLYTLKATLADEAVTDLCAYRDAIWIAYGTASNVEKYDVGGAALTTPAPNFKAQTLCQYSSMLFYAFNDAATDTWRINRYDPENTDAVADLAILSPDPGTTALVRSLVALGPDLFVVCAGALWKFTSQNGNSGVLSGPIDEWLSGGSAGVGHGDGYGACAFQGALLYPAGTTLRRHQPGGGSRQIWPVPPSRNNPATAEADMTLGAWPLTGLAATGDRVYAVAQERVATSTMDERVLCWTGSGMHVIARKRTTYGSATGHFRALLVESGGFLFVGDTTATATATGGALGWFGVGGLQSGARATSSTWVSSVLDFGLYDLDKVISAVRVLGTVPNVSTYTIAVALVDVVAGTSHALAQSGTYSTSGDRPSLIAYTSATPLVGRLWRFEITFTCPAGADEFPEVLAISCIPNPVYPVRYGFRLTIPVGTHVRLHSGDMAYADQAAVDAALDYCRTLRASSYPFTLDYLDGASYTVRCNTISIARDMQRPGESAWLVQLDLQQLSG